MAEQLLITADKFPHPLHYFGTDNWAAVRKWAREHTTGDFFLSAGLIGFTNEVDRIMFKLSFKGRN